MRDLRTDAVVERDAARDLQHVGADLLRQIGDLVDEGDLGGEENIGGIFGQFGGAPVGEQMRRPVEIERSVKLAHRKDPTGTRGSQSWPTALPKGIRLCRLFMSAPKTTCRRGGPFVLLHWLRGELSRRCCKSDTNCCAISMPAGQKRASRCYGVTNGRSLGNVACRQITPGHSGAQHKDTIHDLAVVYPCTSSAIRQQRFEQPQSSSLRSNRMTHLRVCSPGVSWNQSADPTFREALWDRYFTSAPRPRTSSAAIQRSKPSNKELAGRYDLVRPITLGQIAPRHPGAQRMKYRVYDLSIFSTGVLSNSSASTAHEAPIRRR